MPLYAWIGFVGYVAAWAGHFLGCLSTAAAKEQSNRLQGCLMGFTAGLLIAFVCFEILPAPLAQGNLYYGIAAVLAGVALSAWMEGRMNQLSHWRKASLLLALGLSVHHLPEGLALGAVLRASTPAGLSLALMIGIHCLPESLAVTLPMRQAGVSTAKILLLPFLLALPMGLGAFAGGWLCDLSSQFVNACLGFSGGVMLYITCGEILPESHDLWRGRLSAVGAMIGFVCGIWMTAKL
ncbi:MAG: ZIP family metal transporter [Clostridiales bacterium]|jgi:ZIP family zinc transporter|nr:ZIP family metal transporter [Clostridiales bacterium]